MLEALNQEFNQKLPKIYQINIEWMKINYVIQKGTEITGQESKRIQKNLKMKE